MKSSMGTSSSTRSQTRKPRELPANRKPTMLMQSQPLDIGVLPQFEMQQSQSISTYQALPPLVLSRQQLSRRDKIEKQAKKVEVLDDNPDLTDLIDKVKSIMKELHSNMGADMKAKAMSYQSVEYFDQISALYYTDMPMEHKRLIGDEIAANNGGQLISKFLKALSPAVDDDTRTPPDNSPISYTSYKMKCKLSILSVCLKSSEASQEFCIDLGRSGVFQTLVAYVTDNVDKQKFDELTKASVSVLRNCARFSDNKVSMKEAKALEAMAPYLKSDDFEVSMLATLIVAHIAGEEDRNIVSTDKAVIVFLCQNLLRAMKTPDHQYREFTAEEIVSALMNLASDDEHKETIVNEGIIPFLEELLKKGNTREKTIAAKTVWVLSFSKNNQKKMLENKDLIKSLKVLSKMEGAWRQAATGAIWVLEEEKRMSRKMQQSETSAQTKQMVSKFTTANQWYAGKPVSTRAKAKRLVGGLNSDIDEKAASDQHIMISYQWGCQKLMIKVKEQLEKTGYRVWIDIESMGGSTLQAMAEAVENAAVVLLCMSRKYKDSPNCRTEAEYAYKLGKPLIPIRVEQNYEPDGWLGALQGAKLYYDLSNIVEFDGVFAKLSREIGIRGKTKNSETDRQSTSSLSNSTTVALPAQSQTVRDWRISDVKSWAAQNKLAMSQVSTTGTALPNADQQPSPPRKNINNIDGETLLFLKGLRIEAPEFYYRFVSDRLGVTELRGLRDLNTALTKLES